MGGVGQGGGQAAIRALVITGAGRAFCAGADLAEFDFAPGPNVEDLMRRADPGPVIEQLFNPTARRLQSLRMPTIAAVNGVAAGAGASVVMSCDMAIAAPVASFIQAFSKIGLDSRCGWQLVFTAAPRFGAGDGFGDDGGQIDCCSSQRVGHDLGCGQRGEDCVAAATALAERIAAMPTKAMVATRHLLRDASTRTLNQQLDAERDAQSAMGHTHDYIEGVMAFKEKRPAKFRGA